MKLVQPNYIAAVKSAVKSNYAVYIKFLKDEKPFDDIKEGSSSYFTTFWDDHHKEIFKLPYSNLSFYWFNLLDQYYNISSLLWEHRSAEDRDEKDEIEEELFQLWESTELAKHFLDRASTLGNYQASVELLNTYEMQVISFYHLHLANEEGVDLPYFYRLIPELGDGPSKVYLQESRSYFCPKKEFIRDELLEIKGKDELSVVLMDEKESTFSCPILHEQPTAELNLRLPSTLTDDQLELAQAKFSWATAILKNHFPQYWQLLTAFTQHVIPVDEEGIVSYSLQMLPGFSCLNLVQRDYLETLDDLLHENGHHYLNSHLNHQELINEDDEKIYWSPWRKQLRPIRGIYHAYCTFYWAAMFFNDFTLSLKSNEELKKMVLSKDPTAIARSEYRAWEECTMLEICHAYLDHAYQDEKVTEDGQTVYKTFRADLESKKKYFKEAEDSLNVPKHPYHAKYKETKKMLEQNVAKYWNNRR